MSSLQFSAVWFDVAPPGRSARIAQHRVWDMASTAGADTARTLQLAVTDEAVRVHDDALMRTPGVGQRHRAHRAHRVYSICVVAWPIVYSDASLAVRSASAGARPYRATAAPMHVCLVLAHTRPHSSGAWAVDGGCALSRMYPYSPQCTSHPFTGLSIRPTALYYLTMAPCRGVFVAPVHTSDRSHISMWQWHAVAYVRIDSTVFVRWLTVAATDICARPYLTCFAMPSVLLVYVPAHPGCLVSNCPKTIASTLHHPG